MENTLSLVNSRDIAAYTLEFKAGGNPRNTGGFSSTGTMPNLPGYLREHNMHPLDYYHVNRLLSRRNQKDVTVSIYQALKPGSGHSILRGDEEFVYILVEIVVPHNRSITYVLYQVERADLEQIKQGRFYE